MSNPQQSTAGTTTRASHLTGLRARMTITMMALVIAAVTVALVIVLSNQAAESISAEREHAVHSAEIAGTQFEAMIESLRQEALSLAHMPPVGGLAGHTETADSILSTTHRLRCGTPDSRRFSPRPCGPDRRIDRFA